MEIGAFLLGLIISTVITQIIIKALVACKVLTQKTKNNSNKVIKSITLILMNGIFCGILLNIFKFSDILVGLTLGMLSSVISYIFD